MMTVYFQELGWTPIAENERPDHLARLLENLNIFEDFSMFEWLNNHKLAPPASKEVVANLPSVTVLENGTQCPVCLKHYDKGENALILPCNHIFHSECIVCWLQRTNSCPLCRFELTTDDEHYETYRKEKARAKEREADLEALHNLLFW